MPNKQYGKTISKSIIGEIFEMPCLILEETKTTFKILLPYNSIVFRAKTEVKLYKRTPKIVKKMFENM